MTPAPSLRLHLTAAKGALVRQADGKLYCEHRFQLHTGPGAELCQLIVSAPEAHGNHTLYASWDIGQPGAPVDSETLAAADCPTASHIVQDLIPRGLTILASRPKSGKSFWILDLGLCVARGEPWQGHQAERGPVVYCALEDTYGRLQERLATLTSCPPSDLHVATALATGDSGFAQLAAWVEDYRPLMLIIDTLGRWRAGAASSYAKDYKLAGQLKTLADGAGASLVLVHHTKKAATRNPLDSVSGSTGLTGAADAVLILARDPASPQGGLYVTGKDVPEAVYPMLFHGGRWTKVRTDRRLTSTTIGRLEHKP